MIAGLDSSFSAPTPAQADAAAAAGVRLWSGYIALPGGGIGLAAPWTAVQFAAARRCGAPPLGFCSGWDDPVQLRALAQAWGVRLCLDCEQNIRDLGGWTQPWLDASGAGLYGLRRVHGLRAAFHVLAAYPGSDPGATWSGTPPADGAPRAWQWEGTHLEFGASVDRGWFDDWFQEGVPMTPDERLDLERTLTRIVYEACRRAEPESQDAITAHAAAMAADGVFELEVSRMFDSASEFVADLALDRQIRADYQAGKLGGSASTAAAVAAALRQAADVLSPPPAPPASLTEG